MGYAVLNPTGTSADNPGFTPSIAIEFDTHFNNSGSNIDLPAQNSTSDDHLAIQLNGDVDHSQYINNTCKFGYYRSCYYIFGI